MGDPSTEPLRLHIGGTQVRQGWKILNIQPGSGVDFVGDCVDLSQFADRSVEEVYASHVYEHLDYQTALPKALRAVWRVLRPGGMFRIGVPDLETLCKLFVHPQLDLNARFHIMRMVFGGQVDPYDFHRVGLSFEFLCHFLGQAGFTQAQRVQTFGLFDDASSLQFGGVYISLNIIATK